MDKHLDPKLLRSKDKNVLVKNLKVSEKKKGGEQNCSAPRVRTLKRRLASDMS